MRIGWPVLAVIAVFLAGCSGSLFDSSGPSPATTTTRLDEGQLSAAEIHSILAGKTWRFVGPNNTGTTVYAADGTSLVEVDGKGTTKGTWSTKDGQLCESFQPAPFLPGGVPLTCYPFSGSGSVYQAGKAKFTLAS
jgi:hypothetical protein